MCAEQDELAGQRPLSRKPGEHIHRMDANGAAADRRYERQPKRASREAPGRSRDSQLSEILPCLSQQAGGGRRVEPSSHAGGAWRRVGGRHLLAQPGTGNLFPGREERLPVDHEHGGGAAPQAFVHLVLPEAVVAALGTTELGRVLIGRGPGEREHDLAGHVGAGVVVPALFRRGDPVADEDGISRDRGGVSRAGQISDEVRADVQLRSARGAQARGERPALERDRLKVGPAVTGRLQPEALELGRDVAGGQHSPPRTGAAAFQRVGGEELEVRSERVGSHRPRSSIGRGLGRGQAWCSQENHQPGPGQKTGRGHGPPPGPTRNSDVAAQEGRVGESAAASVARTSTRTCWAMPSTLIHGASSSFG